MGKNSFPGETQIHQNETHERQLNPNQHNPRQKDFIHPFRVLQASSESLHNDQIQKKRSHNERTDHIFGKCRGLSGIAG